MKKVLIITYYWPPSGGAGVQRWVKFTKYLCRLGHEPIILTVDPQYATYPQIDKTLHNDIPESVKVYYAKSFELYSLYKKISTNKEVPYGGFANTKKLDFKEKVLRFIRGNFFIPDPRKGWNRYAVSKAKQIIKEHNIDTVITTSPPHSTQLIGLKLKKQLDIKWIADLRDPWTDIYYFKDLYPTRIATNLNKHLEKRVLNASDLVITVSEDLKRIFQSKLKSNKRQIVIIPNGFDSDDFLITKNQTINENLTISYVGTLSNDYKIDSFIESVNNLPEEIRSNVRIRFVGKISEEQLEKFHSADFKNNLEIVGYVDHEKAINYMLSSDVLLLIIPNVANNNGILTGKLFEYIATNRTILLLGPVDGDAAKIVKETQCGLIHSYDDMEGIRNSLISFQANKVDYTSKSNPKSLQYSRENLTKKLIELL